MAQNATIKLAAQSWTQITNADVDALRVQNTSDYMMSLSRGIDVAPVDQQGALVVGPYQVVLNERLEDLWPGQSGNRVWAWCERPVTVSVSHA